MKKEELEIIKEESIKEVDKEIKLKKLSTVILKDMKDSSCEEQKKHLYDKMIA